MSQLDFAALLCSRLCHDLVSPVGAITNGLEILRDNDDPALREQVIDLLNKSAEQASNKLQFFRLAFGAAGGFSTEIDFNEARKSVEAFLDGTRITLDWQVPDKTASKSAVKLLLNMVLVASEALIRGGTLLIECKDEKRINFRVTVQGQRVIVQENMLGLLQSADDTTQAIEARTAPVFLAASLAREMNGELFVAAHTGEIFSLEFRAD